MKAIDDDVVATLIKMRMDGSSQRHIMDTLCLSKGTVSKYCRGLRGNNKPDPSSIKRAQAAATKAFSDKWAIKRSNIRAKAKAEWVIVRSDPELLAFIAFYWAEGRKRFKNKTGFFAVTNSDPGLISVCVRTLKRLRADLVATVAVYDGQDVELAKQAWENAIGIEVKVHIAKKMNPNDLFYSKHGTCTVVVKKSFELWHSIMEWIECWRSDAGVSDSWQLTPRY